MKNKIILLFVVSMQCAAMSSVYAASDDMSVQNNRLTVEQRYAIITKKLENVKKSNDLNLKLLAGWIKVHEKDGIEMHIDEAQAIATKEKSDVLTMRHFEKMYYQHSGGSKRGLFDPTRLIISLSDDKQESALHESAHIIASVYHPKMIALGGTIVPRKKASGIYLDFDRSDDRNDWTISDDEKSVIINLAGPVAEQVFNIQSIGYVKKVWDKYIHHQKYDDVELSYEELVKRTSADADLDGAQPAILFIASNRCRAQGLDCDSQDEATQEKCAEIVNQVTNELYHQTVEFVQDHKPEIEKLAAIMYAKNYVSSDEIYAVCGMQRPLLDIEKK